MNKSHVLGLILPIQRGLKEQATNDLRDLFLTALDDRQRDVVIDAIKAIRTESQITARFINSQIASINKVLGQPVDEKLQENIQIYVETLHDGGKATGFGTVEISLNPWDTQAQEWHKENAVYWIGKNYTKDLSDRLKAALLPAFTEGADQVQLSKLLAAEMEGYLKRSLNYYEGLSNHIVTRSFNFGLLSGWTDAEIDRYIISAVIDDRTTDICRFMDGKVFSVARGMEFATDMINTTDPEAVKELAPWLEPSDLPDGIGDDGDALPEGMAMPPYHWLCRTTAISG